MPPSLSRDVAALLNQLKAVGLSYPAGFPCGKRMGQALYLHHSAARPFLSKAAQRYLDLLLADKSAGYGVVAKLDLQATPYRLLSLTESPDWNHAHEPQLGNVHTLTDGRWQVTPPAQDPLVYHHKWLFVAPGYTGFDPVVSMRRSLHWKQVMGGPDRALSSRIGRRRFWHQWLSQHNLPR